MDAEVPTGRVFRLLFFWIVLGIVLEFRLIPREDHGLLSAVNGNSLFMNADFYYALSDPATFQAQSQQGGKCSYRAHIDGRRHESGIFLLQTGWFELIGTRSTAHC
jgi:hypothetical protein